MWSEEPAIEDLLHELDVAETLTGTTQLPSRTVLAKYILVGRIEARQPKDAAKKYRYYYRLIFHAGPRIRVSQYLDAGDKGSVGALKSLSGDLIAAKPEAAVPGSDHIFLEKQVLAVLDPLKDSIAVDGPRGEKLLARNASIRVHDATPVHVRYDVMTIAEEAAEFAGCSRCPHNCNGEADAGHSLPGF